MNSGQWTTDRAHAHCLLRWAKKGVHLNLHWTDWPKNRQTTRWLLYIASSNFVWQKRENDKNEKCCRNIAQNSSDLFILTEKAMPCLFSSAYSPFLVLLFEIVVVLKFLDLYKYLQEKRQENQKNRSILPWHVFDVLILWHYAFDI